MSEKHLKQDFKIERLAFFGDAIFAIAITLLVIEFKVPEVTKESIYDEIWKLVAAMKYKLFALLLIFFMIARYWMKHHTLFEYIHNYNKKMLTVNMALLHKYKVFTYDMEEADEDVFGLRILITSMSFLLVFILSYFLFDFSLYGLLPVVFFSRYRKY